MIEQRELVIIGGGPAGMSAAMSARANGVDVVVLDESATPGGQVYRAVETTGSAISAALGEDYAHGAALVASFRNSDVEYRPGSMAWEVTPECVIHASCAGQSQTICAQRVVIATGALERPFPIPGWTLPGVLSAGGAQSLLKTAGIVPDEGVVLAGTGPLLLLLAVQYLNLGVSITAVLETTSVRDLWCALPYLPAAATSGNYLAKGWGLLRTLRRAGVQHLRGGNKSSSARRRNATAVGVPHWGTLRTDRYAAAVAAPGSSARSQPHPLPCL